MTKRRKTDQRSCVVCGAPLPLENSTYCSVRCMAAAYSARMMGTSNPNYRNAAVRVCRTCGGEYRSYTKTRKYCSPTCYGKSPENIAKCRWMAKTFGCNGPKPDGNHEEITSELRSRGFLVLDLSKEGRGIPDLCVYAAGTWHFIEIKNPKTEYGRQGLSPSQRKWAAKWKGGPVHVAHTHQQALAVLLAPAPAGRALPEIEP